MRLRDRVAIVIGAAQGIGAATAIHLAEEGAHLIICDLDSDQLTQVVGWIEALGRWVLVQTGSVAGRAFVQKMVRQILEKLGGLDILVNNAGIVRDVIGHNMTEEQRYQVINVNLKGVFNCLQACMIPMRRQGSGVIVNLSSVEPLRCGGAV